MDEKPKSSIEELAKILNQTLVNTLPSNVEQNATLWDTYAREWSVEKGFVKTMLKDNNQHEREGVILGEEWSDHSSFIEVIVKTLFYLSTIIEHFPYSTFT